ncbi:uncharacterized protein PHACADRAFT_249598 [Phanerochaete carnosa HHB-10118-sp]|uniref:Uncharacterized protein n=1 Tax=Phanerochaete carnosa (strain HHB-10118-sp) TaxID=650164 RepID=K5W5R7_PHACS|nr:uncharacterized protein PHACADRAFT_249598 [Phanerochaete carnosa HHB-10118-sp]EKM59263.1 hypothetical protein PHACADRAFT_249598 [Phanerochaete carnosa HHB-10118-sp]
MQRPGPLRDIPLDRVNLADNASYPVSFKHRPNKRPLSPNASPICTPVKRQITNPDAAGSSEKSSRALLWSLIGDPSTPVRVQVALPDISVTPRKLSFGVAGPEEISYGSPMKCTPPSSPRLSAAFLSPDAMDVDDCFTPTQPATPLPLEPVMPAATDRNSIHYPGFDVYIDRDNTSVMTLPPSLSRKSSVGLSSAKRSKEHDKENISPRVKLTRAGKEDTVGKAAIGASMKAVGVENWAPRASEDEYSHSPKPRLNPHQLVNRGQAIPWLTPDCAPSSNVAMPLLTRLMEVGAEGSEWEEDM